MPDDPQWISAGYLENVESLRLQRSGQASSNVSISGIKLNGRLLSQVYRLVDASGRGNDTDENLNFLPYVAPEGIDDWVNPISQWQWVRGVTQDPSGITGKGLLFSDVDVEAVLLLVVATLVIFDIHQHRRQGAKIEIYVNAFGDSFASRDCQFKGVGQNKISCVSQYGNASPQWRDITEFCPNGLEYVEFVTTEDLMATGPHQVCAIRVNDKLLIQTGTKLFPLRTLCLIHQYLAMRR